MASFSTKHYVMVAGLMSKTYGWVTSDPQFSVVDEVVTEFADAFEADNPRFDRMRFIKACQPKQAVSHEA